MSDLHIQETERICRCFPNLVLGVGASTTELTGFIWGEMTGNLTFNGLAGADLLRIARLVVPKVLNAMRQECTRKSNATTAIQK